MSLLDVRAVAQAIAIGERTLWRWIATGLFPEPDLAVGRKYRRWKQETVDRWVENQAAAALRAHR